MNQKGQDDALFGGFVILIILVIAFVGYSLYPRFNGGTSIEDIAANNFCEAWANEQDYTLIKGWYNFHPTDGWEICCKHSINAETFDGGISEGTIKYKYFKISEEDLQEWVCVK